MIYFTYNKNQTFQLFPNTRNLFSKILDTKNISVRITNVFKLVVLFIFEIIELLRNKLSYKDIRPKNSIVSRLNLFIKSNKSPIIKTAIITTTIAAAYYLKKRFSPDLEVTLSNSSKSELLKDICLKQDFVKAPFESSINSLQIEFDAIKNWVNSATANYKEIDTKFLDFVSRVVKDATKVTDNFDSDLAKLAYQTISNFKTIDSNLLRVLSTIKNLSKFKYLFEKRLKEYVSKMLDSVIDWPFYQINIFSKIEKLKNAGLIDNYDLEMLLIKFACKLLDRASSLNSMLIKNISILKNLLPNEKNWSSYYYSANISNEKLDIKLLDFASRAVKDTDKVTDSVKSLFTEIRSLYSNNFDFDLAELAYQTISSAKNIDSNLLKVLSNIKGLSEFNYYFEKRLKEFVSKMLDSVIDWQFYQMNIFSKIEKLKNAGFIDSYDLEMLLTKFACNLLDNASSINSSLIENISMIKKLLPNVKNWHGCYATSIRHEKIDTKLLDFASKVVKDISEVTDSVKPLFAEVRSLYSNNFDSDLAEHAYQTISNAKNIDSNLLKVLSNIKDLSIKDLSISGFPFKVMLKKFIDKMIDKVIANYSTKNDVFSKFEKLIDAGFIDNNEIDAILTEIAYKLLDSASSLNNALIENISEIKELLPNLTNSPTYENKLKALFFRILNSVNNFDSDFIKRLSMIKIISSNNELNPIFIDYLKPFIRKKLFESKNVDDNLIKFISEIQPLVSKNFLNNILRTFTWIKIIENIKLPSFSETKSQLKKLKPFMTKTKTKTSSINSIIKEASLRYELGFPLPSMEEVKDEEYFLSEKDEKTKEFIKAYTLIDEQRILNEKLNPKNAIDALKILGLFIQRNIPDLFNNVRNSAKSNYRKITLKTHPDKLKDLETKARLLPVFLRAGDALETIVNCLKNEIKFAKHNCFKNYL